MVEEIHTLQPNVTLLKSFLPREIKIATARAQGYRSKQSHGTIRVHSLTSIKSDHHQFPPHNIRGLS